MLKKAYPLVDSYHGDLFHDALFLNSKSEEFKNGTEIRWSVGECGTHLAVHEDGEEGGYVPPWIKSNCYRNYTHFRIWLTYLTVSETDNRWQIYIEQIEYPPGSSGA